MKRFPRQDRRALFLGALAIGAIVIAGKGYPRWLAWTSVQEERAWRAEARLDRVRRIILTRSARGDSIASARRQYLALAPGLLAGAGAATAAAALVAWVSGAAHRNGLTVGDFEALDDSITEKHFLGVAIRGEVTGDVTGLTGFLQMLEEGPTVATVRELSVDQPEPGAPATRAESLRVRLVVEGIGLWRAAAP